MQRYSLLVYFVYVTIFATLERMACSKCSNQTMSGRTLCSEHWAEYMRDYRSKADGKRERAAYQKGAQHGFEACIKYLREHVAGRSLSGYETAKVLEKNMLGPGAPELIAQRKLIASMRG